MFTTVIGIDLGKSTFHLVAHDAKGNQVLRKPFTRKKLMLFLQQHCPTTVAFEACCGAHWLGRRGRQFGHTVKLIPPQYVRPYMKTNKNDFADANAIAEAASRGSMRFVAVKSEHAQVIAATIRLRGGVKSGQPECAELAPFGGIWPQTAQRACHHETIVPMVGGAK